MVNIVLPFESKVKNLLNRIFGERKNYKIINVDRDPIKINNPSRMSHFALNYVPDFCAENRKNGKRILFEILDTQNEQGTIADIMRCLLYKECSKAIFITKDSESTDHTVNVVETIRQHIKRLSSGEVLDIVTIESNFDKYSEEQILQSIVEEVDKK